MLSAVFVNDRIVNALSKSPLSAIALFLVCPLIVGCSTSQAAPKETLVPVTGTVMIEGKAIPGVKVTFIPKGTTPGSGGIGVTDDSGEFELMNRSRKSGIVPGSYAVHFSLFKKPDGTPVPPGQSPTNSGGRESIPKLWSDVSISQPHNSVMITDATKPLEFTIGKK
jgi:hypothetical protein